MDSDRRTSVVRDPVALALLVAAHDGLATSSLRDAALRRCPPVREGGVVGAVVAALAVCALVTSAAVAAAEPGPPRCASVAYAVDASFGPTGATELVAEVLDEVELSSGLSFTPGATAAVLRFSWEPPSSTQLLVDEIGHADVRWRTTEGVDAILWAEVRFRNVVDAEAMATDPLDWHTVVRHEVGHVLGLEHTEQPTDVMHPIVGGRSTTWSPGEQRLLAGRGLAAGC